MFRNVILIVVVSLATSSATAALLAYEPFDYTVSTELSGQTNGVGFKSAWSAGGFNATITKGFEIRPGMIDHPSLARTGANHLLIKSTQMEGIAALGRQLPTNLASAGTWYLSFLMSPQDQSGFAAVVLGTGHGEELSIGKSSTVNRYHLARRGQRSDRIYSEIEAIVGKTRFIVVKM